MAPRRRNRAAGSDSLPSFFEGREEWSRWKHETLAKYLRLWVAKLGSSYQTLAFVDACAGEGRYDDGSDGSPVIAAKMNDDQVSARRRNVLLVHACEEDPETAQRLAAHLAPWTCLTPPRVSIYPRPFFEVLPEIVEATRAVPSLFFIDPYGIDAITGDRLAPLLEDRNRASTEVLVRADPVMLARLAGWLTDRQRPSRSAAAASTMKALLERLNVDTAELQQQLDASDGMPVDRNELFAQYLELFEHRFGYVQIMPIRPGYFAAPKYFLIHGTDSPHGAACFNDIVATTEDDLYQTTEDRQAARTGQGSLFQTYRAPRHRRNELATFGTTILAQCGSVEFIELRAAMAMRFGPDFREKDHKAAVQTMIAEGAAEPIQGQISAATIIRRRGI